MIFLIQQTILTTLMKRKNILMHAYIWYGTKPNRPKENIERETAYIYDVCGLNRDPTNH